MTPTQKGWKRTAGRVGLVLLLLVLAAYPASRMGLFTWPRAYDPLAVPDLGQTPGFLTQYQMKLADFEPENCRAAFRLVGQSVAFVPVKGAGTNCEVSDAIGVRRFATARIRPEDMRCAIAARLYAWDKHVLQPAAQRAFGTTVAEIIHFGSYNCRTMRDSNRMSEHAGANAFDIAGFKLADGRQISVLKDWNGSAENRRFLRTVRDGLCDWFNVTLSPDYNALHADHFHVDMGYWRSCR